MKKPKLLTGWDFSDTVSEPDGYDFKQVPDLTRRNFQILVEEYNNLVECFNKLCEIKHVEFSEE